MRASARVILSAAVACLSAGALWADEPKAGDVAAARAFVREVIEPTPLARAVGRRVRALVADLASDRWEVRHGASTALLEIGPKAGPLVRQALASADPEMRTRAEVLLATYRASQEGRPDELARAVDVLARAEDKLAIDALVRLLGHEDVGLRYSAEYGLRRLTGGQFGYSACADPPERLAAAERWRAWWRERRPGFRFRAGRAPAEIAGILVCDTSAREVVLVGLNGKDLWSKKFNGKQRPYAADAVPGGGAVVVLYGDGKSILAEFARDGKLIRSSAPLDIRYPMGAIQRLGNGNVLGTDRVQGRVIEINPAGNRVVWQYCFGPPACPGASAERLGNGNTLICLRYRTVFEVNRAGRTVWTHRNDGRPTDAQKLANGNVLITEQQPRRVVEVTRGGKEVWTWTSEQGRLAGACRLPDGRTVIQDSARGLLLVDRSGKVLRMLSPRRLSWRIKLRPVAAGAGAEARPTATRGGSDPGDQ